MIDSRVPTAAANNIWLRGSFCGAASATDMFRAGANTLGDIGGARFNASEIVVVGFGESFVFGRVVDDVDVDDVDVDDVDVDDVGVDGVDVVFSGTRYDMVNGMPDIPSQYAPDRTAWPHPHGPSISPMLVPPRTR